MNELRHFVETPEKASQVLDSAARILSADPELPKRVFRVPYPCFAFFDYSVLQDAACWIEFLKFANIATLVYVSPTAEDIFAASNGANYGIAQFTSGMKQKELQEALSTSPTANLADAFVYGCMRCVAMVESAECAIFGDRYWDLAVAGFQSTMSRERFREYTSSWPYMAVNDAAKRVKTQSGPKDRSEFIAALKTNYPNAMPFS